METRTPPGLYLEPPSFDISLDDFMSLPRRRVEAIRLLHEGQATEVSDGSLAQQALTDDARLLLLHGHGDRPSEAQHHRADLASHFVLKLACCGGHAGEGESEVHGDGKGGGRRGGEEHPDRRWDRREWFVRAETDLFEARLHWHLRGGDDRPGKNGQGTSAKPETKQASRGDRLEALRIVYRLGWLQPEADGPDGVGAEAIDVRESADREITDPGAGRGKGKRPRWISSKEEAISWSRLQSGAYERDLGNPLPAQTKASRHPTLPGLSLTSYFSCPFDKVLPLVRSRRVLLRDGKALLSPEQVPAAVVQHFKEGLRKGVTVAERGLPGVERDERVKEVLVQVRRDIDRLVRGRYRQGGDDDNRASVAITRQNIDQVAEKHFPLCMRRTLRILRREHHLKNEARVQLVSFLGNAGMEVHELLGLWRDEFPRGMPAEEYARKRNQYEYSLRHLYGLEGRRKAYSPRSCARIASLGGGGGSGAGGYGHGCPFHAHSQTRGFHSSDRAGAGAGAFAGDGSKSTFSTGGSANSRRSDDSSLHGMLEVQNISTVDIEDIVGPLQNGGGGGGGGGCSDGKAVGACRRHYLATHRWAPGSGVWGAGGGEASPNGWLAASSRPRQQQQPPPPEAFLTQEGGN